jgi:hypothetical protein
MEYSRDNHFPVYLATPMGALLKYPGTYVNDGIYQFLPSDSRDPLRRNTVDSSIGPKDERTWDLGTVGIIGGTINKTNDT